jgi:hypothetical protein
VQLAKVVDECWNRRMQLGDPDKAAAQLDRVSEGGGAGGLGAGCCCRQMQCVQCGNVLGGDS